MSGTIGANIFHPSEGCSCRLLRWGDVSPTCSPASSCLARAGVSGSNDSTGAGIDFDAVAIEASGQLGVGTGHTVSRLDPGLRGSRRSRLRRRANAVHRLRSTGRSPTPLTSSAPRSARARDRFAKLERDEQRVTPSTGMERAVDDDGSDLVGYVVHAEESGPDARAGAAYEWISSWHVERNADPPDRRAERNRSTTAACLGVLEHPPTRSTMSSPSKPWRRRRNAAFEDLSPALVEYNPRLLSRNWRGSHARRVPYTLMLAGIDPCRSHQIPQRLTSAPRAHGRSPDRVAARVNEYYRIMHSKRGRIRAEGKTPAWTYHHPRVQPRRAKRSGVHERGHFESPQRTFPIL